MSRSTAVFIVILLAVLFSGDVLFSAPVNPIPIPKIDIGITEAKDPKDVALSLQILLLLTVLTMAPAIALMMTSFTRIMIVLSFVRTALATQQMPPNQVLTGLAMFLTFFIMAPTLTEVNQSAVQPFLAKKVTAMEAYSKGIMPLREFMFKQTRQTDIGLFIKMAKLKRPKNPNEVPTHILIPAFMISELKTSFQMGILIFIPFIVIDIVVASTLMSMGMIMLPPVMISLPFKILLFVMVDGWYLLTKSLIESFHV